jgi:hypothetical protein
MARSISRSPLFHKGLTVFTTNGKTLPLADPSPIDSHTREAEGVDNNVLSARHTSSAGDGEADHEKSRWKQGS